MASDEVLHTLGERIQALCLARRLTLATAESCTGGLVADALTDRPGSSGYFRGGVVAYADDIKRDVLDVPAELLAAHGAVSAQVARAMASGVRASFGTDLAVAVTGIAGPDGGSESKPVGLTYLAVADDRGVDVRRVVWAGDRAANKRSSAVGALELVLGRLEPGAADSGAGGGERAGEAAGEAVGEGASEAGGQLHPADDETTAQGE